MTGRTIRTSAEKSSVAVVEWKSLAPSHAVVPQANVTTVAELSGIKIAHTIGDNIPAAAMLMPTKL